MRYTVLFISIYICMQFVHICFIFLKMYIVLVSFLYEMAGKIMVSKASCFVTLFVMLNEELTLQELYQHYSH